MTTSPEPVWRAACRRLAQARAEAETRQRGGRDAGDGPIYPARWIHVQEVVRLARWLATETGADPAVVEMAGWLHDIRKGEPDHARRGALEAGRVLADLGVPPDQVALAVAAIRLHEGLVRTEVAPLQPLEAAVLWDADKLSKLGVQALFAAMAAGGIPGGSLHERRRHMADFTTQVFSGTVASMNTEPARQEARRRYAEMTRVLALWARDEIFPEPGGEAT